MRCSGHNGFTNYRKRRRQKTDHHDHNIYSLLGEAADYFTHSGSIFPRVRLGSSFCLFHRHRRNYLFGNNLKKTKALSGNPSPFVMELPAYHVPGVKNVALNIWDKTKSFIKKAGTIIFLASTLVWFLSNFNWRLQMVDASDSMLAGLETLSLRSSFLWAGELGKQLLQRSQALQQRKMS